MGMDQDRLDSWVQWYRFARETLEYSHAEAVAYANVRTTEDANRRKLREQRPAA